MNFDKIKTTFLSVLFFLLALSAEAALNLSANPADGGNTLRLGRVDEALEATKGVKLRVSSSDGRQYQIFQRLEDSLTNERQTILDPQALSTYTISGSNASGTLYSQQNEPLRLTDQLLYTSSPDGQSDTLTVMYAVDPQRLNASGNFMGRIVYVVRSLGGGGQDQAILNVYLEAATRLKIEVAGTTVRDGLRLKYSRGTMKNDVLLVRFEGNTGGNLTVSAEMQNFPKNDLGEELPDQVLQLSSAGGRGQQVASISLGHKPLQLYKSRENSDEFEVDFTLAPESLKAGVYRGTMIVTLDSADGTQEFPLDVEITIEPVFEVKVTLPPGGLRFSHVLPTEPPQVAEIQVEVTTNLAKPYMVIHSMATPLTTSRGDTIDNDHFSMKIEPVGDFSGRTVAGDFVPVQTGEMPVFFSDRHGSSARFKVFYRLKSYPGVAPGDYSAPIVYSLGEM